MKKLVVVMWLLMAVGFLSTAVGYAGDVNSEMELLRSDVRTEKIAIITKQMNLTEPQSKAFWPVYRKYETELAKIFDDKLALIKDYAANYEKMNDDKARDLLEGALQLEERTITLQRKYSIEMGTVVSATTVTRFFQIERRINRLIDLQISAALPLVR
jgi:hypothetical protein